MTLHGVPVIEEVLGVVEVFIQYLIPSQNLATLFLEYTRIIPILRCLTSLPT